MDGIVAEVRRSDPTADVDLVERALDAALRAHTGQMRRSGEPYLMHPLRVADTIARLGLDAHSVAASLLHDAVEDSDLSVYDLTETFGRDVAALVDGVTKLGKVPYLSRREQAAESFRKMLVAMSKDIRVLLVKLADRLDNMRTLEHMPPEKRERIAQETMEIYAPLARRLGVDWLRSELQDLAFRWLEPVSFEETSRHIDELLGAHPGFVEGSIERLRRAFSGDAETPDGAGRWPEAVFGPVELRATLRSVYKVFRLGSERGFDQVADLVAYQVITRERGGCYAALGHIHAAFKPVPGRFRDYVALPRPNRYQALHTTVVDREGRRMEVQIRSQDMDAIAERGVVVELAAHGADASGPGRLGWVAELMDWQDEVSDPNEFIEAVKAELFADEVYVFTPEGDIHVFPPQSTPIDFAFAIHSDVGLRCSGARVNGQVVPLRYRLRQGDTVEILTNPRTEPRREWLKMCATSRARAKIKHHLRHKERARCVAAGRSVLEQRLEARGLHLSELEGAGTLAAAADPLGVAQDRGTEGIYEEIGAGRVPVDEVVRLLAPGDGNRPPEADRNLLTRVLRRMAGRPAKSERRGEGDERAPIRITAERISSGGRGDGLVVLSDCCSPLPGDPLVGFLVPGRGIVAHVQGCPEALEQVDGRRVYLAWEERLELERPITLEVRTTDSVGLLAEMSRAFSHHGVNIKQANCRAYDQGRRALNTFHVDLRSLPQLEALVTDLKLIRGVIAVERVFGGGDEALSRSSSHG
jgi:GTP pyrophosphokinase